MPTTFAELLWDLGCMAFALAVVVALIIGCEKTLP